MQLLIFDGIGLLLTILHKKLEKPITRSIIIKQKQTLFHKFTYIGIQGSVIISMVLVLILASVEGGLIQIIYIAFSLY